ncbi:MAG: trigger factor [Epsilonproteobacteria bacterium]|nr:MAG: trigger factor [Campylobacterota bacterium]RLA66267.1 MAG: trigger factor [Campylobacterota bacterium]
MTYNVESVNGCTKKLIFNYETLDLAPQIEKAVKEKQKSVSMKGFRAGHAPLDMVKQLYGPQIESDALNHFIQDEFWGAVEKEKINFVGQPSFENVKYEQGKTVSFDVVVEIFPEVTLPDLTKFSFTKETFEVTSDEVEAAKKQALESKVEMAPVEDKKTELAKDHFAIFNFEGVRADGSRPDNMKGKDFELQIGSGRFIPGFEEQMIGMKSSENKNIDLTFPEDYHEPSLKNEKVTFEVELLEIKEKKYPEFSEELLKSLGVESEAELDEKNREVIASQKERQSEEGLKEEIIKKIVTESAFDVPQTMVERQKEFLEKDMRENLSKQGYNESMVKDYFEKFAGDLSTKAEFQVRASLVLDTLTKKYNIETSEADFEEKLSESAQQFGMEVADIKKFYDGNAEAKKNMMFSLREEKTFKKIMEEVKVS